MSLMGNKLKSSGKFRTETLKFANNISSKSVWDALEHQPSDRVFSHCGVVKFVVDLESDPENPTPYFFSSKVCVKISPLLPLKFEIASSPKPRSC